MITNSGFLTPRLRLTFGPMSRRMSGTVCSGTSFVTNAFIRSNLIHWIFRNVTLQDHIQTVAAYLNDYKEAADSEKATLASSFSSYLLSVCSRRMYNRVSSWPAIGFIS